MPKQDSIQRFISLRASLERERSHLRRRLQEIEQALGGAAAPAAATAPVARRRRRVGKAAKAKATKAKVARPNAMSLREAIQRITAKTPLSVRDIVSAVQKGGYHFQSSNPVNSVGAYLYGPEGKKHFKRADGKFAPK